MPRPIPILPEVPVPTIRPYSAARLGGYYAAAAARAGATPRQIAIAHVIGGALAGDTGSGVYVSTRALRERCRSRGVLSSWHDGAPGYGAIVAVLDLLAQVGVLAWPKAHVRRWCNRRGDCDHEWMQPRPIQHGDGWRLPTRCLQVIGWARTLLTFGAARGALPIDTASSEESQVSPCRTGTPVRTPARPEPRTTAPLSSASASGAGGTLDLAALRDWSPPF